MKNWFLIPVFLFAFVLTGCKDNSDPFVDPGKTEDPKWEVTVENDMSRSMTAVVKVSFTEDEGTLAAFIGDECADIASFVDGLYLLYISPVHEEGDVVQLRFYSPVLKRIFVAKETIPYRNDTNLGTTSAPYTPEWTVE